MILAMAGKRTVAVEHPQAHIFEAPVGGWRHIGGVEVDEVGRVGDAVRIVTGRAGGLVVHDVSFVVTETLAA